MLWMLLGILTSYLIGSIPTAYLFGKALKGIDIRKFGSGNVGATNALRVLGKGPGIAVLLLDVLKGAAAVILVGNLVAANGVLLSDESMRLIMGISCILGHNWTIFLNFKGGKGVATTLGVLSALSFQVAGMNLVIALSILTWVLILFLVRIVSVASVSAALFLPFYMFVFKQSKTIIFGAVLFSLFVIFRHKSNLARFFKGEEPRLKFNKSS
jgi:acyl phosphate:glycerol-3-phosphate acyltransferase